jgi:putative ABC transport system permease protein
MGTVWMDIRYALRSFRKAPGFAAVAILSLGLGIGVNSSVFSLVNALLFGFTPYPEPDRLVLVSEMVRTPVGQDRRRPAIANVLDWANYSVAFEGIGIAEGFIDTVPMVVDGPAEAVRHQGISSNLLPVLGVQPLLGRNFREERRPSC